MIRRNVVLAVALGLAAPALAQVDLFTRHPVLIAAREGGVDSLKAALEAGGDPNIADDDGVTALIHAVQRDRVDLVELLLAHRARPDRADRLGSTPLHWAARSAGPDVMDRLIAAGAALEAANRQGFTPLISAVRAERPDAVEALLAAGADPDLQDFTGRSARDWARDARDPRLRRRLAP